MSDDMNLHIVVIGSGGAAMAAALKAAERGASYCQFWWMAVRPHSCLTDRL
ncbi:FAD-binding protein, partial [Chromohalobacter israelensis]|uniref:FAD-binding protein n=1 Tax=Chromohalobacter israelensis TaxID=141390 RepID=UPI0035F088FD